MPFLTVNDSLPEEDCNELSDECILLLQNLKDRLKENGDDRVPASFWACCQIADLDRLRALTTSDISQVLQMFVNSAEIIKECKSGLMLSNVIPGQPNV
jgi:hypothetical protein